MLYTIARGIIWMVLVLFYQFRVTGREHLPEGGYVIACTHMGWLDVLVLGVSIYPHKIHYMAKKELFNNRLLGWLLIKLQAFPVNREHPGPSSLKIPIRLLRKGKVVGIFPSGTRSGKGEAPLKRGATYLAEKASVPLVPAVYIGPPSFSIGDLFKRRLIEVRIGEPLELNTGLELLDVLDEKMKELGS